MKFPRALTPMRLAVGGGLLFLVAVVVFLTTSNGAISNEFLLVPDRAHPLADLVSVPGATHPDNRGGIYYVDVIERKASLLERLFPPAGATVVRHDQLTPPGISDAQRIKADRFDMQLSQQVASAVALRALGYDVRIRENGVRVALVYGDTRATGKLRPGDVIVEAGGKAVRSIRALHEILSRHRVGDIVHVGFLRDGIRQDVDVRLSPDRVEQDPKRAILGILPQPALHVRVPFQVKFDLGDVGGPSAGLAFALEILEERGRDVDHGYRVAATGVIGPDGSVGEIGGVKQKTIGARRAHVDVFLVPAGDNYRDARKYAHGLRVIPVKSFQQALQSLATLPARA